MDTLLAVDSCHQLQNARHHSLSITVSRGALGMMERSQVTGAVTDYNATVTDHGHCRTQRNCAHVTTVLLSWHVQNFVVIDSICNEQEHCEVSSNFEFDRNTVSGTGACHPRLPCEARLLWLKYYDIWTPVPISIFFRSLILFSGMAYSFLYFPELYFMHWIGCLVYL